MLERCCCCWGRSRFSCSSSASWSSSATSTRASDAELIDWFPTRSPEVEVQNEIDDVRQMLEAQNEMRRRRGARELTEADIEARVIEDERWKSRMHRGT